MPTDPTQPTPEKPSEPSLCELCGQPMPPGEEMFKYHGYSGSCPPRPPTPTPGELKLMDKASDLIEEKLALQAQVAHLSQEVERLKQLHARHCGTAICEEPV